MRFSRSLVWFLKTFYFFVGSWLIFSDGTSNEEMRRVDAVDILLVSDLAPPPCAV